MSDAKPLSRDVDTMLACRLCSKTGRPECGIYPGCMKPYVKLDDYRAAAARADAERERAERLREFVAVIALDPDSPYEFKAGEALAADDRHRAGRGEPADDFDWTAWAHGHIAVVEQENIRLAARVRELEEAQGELLGSLDAETGVTVRINGTGRTTAIDIKPGEWPFLAFDRHTGELVS